MRPFQLDGAVPTPLVPGITLLEASAGTGKTYTIAGLAARLVLEYDLQLDRIAVMTFTIAATAELRDRIRTCLADASRAISGTDPAPVGFASWLRQRFSALPASDRAAWLKRLRRARASVDAAPIMTIHAFARRIANDHAARVGIDPAAAMTVDLDAWRADIVRDWFRAHLIAADPRVVRLLGNDPIAVLTATARSTEQHPLAVIATPPCTPAEICARYDAAAAWWAAHEPRLIAHARQHLGGIRGNSIHHPAKLEKRIEQARAAAAGIADPPSSFAEWWSAEKLRVPGACAGFDPTFFTAIPLHLPQGKALAGGLIAAFAAHYRQILDQRCRTAHDLHVSDALLAVNAALEGTDGATLATAIGSRYDAVLVDEFQDTDLLQWRILSRCFAQGRLMLIGDPKQAIYAFRGADVYAYTEARDRVAEDRCFTLTSNFRSDEPLVEATHALYLGDGRTPAVNDPFAVPAVEYHRVAAQKPVRIDPGRLDRAPLQILEIAPELCPSRDAAGEVAAQLVANEIARILTPATAVRLTRDDGTVTAVAPSDIAVLVRSHDQATIVHAQLSRRGIPAVRQDRSTVFTGEAAAELHAVLAGCLDPMRERLVRTAAATRYIGASAGDIIADPPGPALVALPLRFAGLGEILEKQGVGAWWYHTYDTDFGWGTPRQRIAGVADGGRLVMDTLHLVELMAAETTLAPASIADWLLRQRSEDQAGDDKARRLERDDDAVRILTVHVSKGLEYPIVFEAFAWQGERKPQPPLLVHPGDGPTAERHLGAGTPETLTQAEREAMGDGLRKLYVGLTRAMHRLYVVWAPVPANKKGTGSTTSPLAWLLCGRLPDGSAPSVLSGFDDVRAQWEHGPTIPAHAGIAVQRITALPGFLALMREVVAPAVDQRALLPDQRLDRCWSRCSFTGLSQRAVTPEDVDDAEADHDQAMVHVPRADDVAPGGAALGTLVHTLYQHADFGAWRDDPDQVVRELGTMASRDGVALTPAQTGTMAAAMRRAVFQAVPALGPPLADLPASAIAREWPVRLGLKRTSPALASIFAGRTPMAPAWPAALRQVSLPAGVFTGVLDVLLCHDGRYHVVDWKTNLLDAYDQESLWAAMAESHYLLQAHLYLLATHRYLTWRLPGYDPARHLGVAAYAFIRGTCDGDGAAGWAIVHPDMHILGALDACCR